MLGRAIALVSGFCSLTLLAHAAEPTLLHVNTFPTARSLPFYVALDRGFFARHGGKSVFIGRFFGPMRAVIPLAAGVMQMPRGWFWLANVASALVWAPMLLFIGDVAGNLGDRLIGSTNTFILVFGGLTLFGIAGVIWAMLRAARSKS